MDSVRVLNVAWLGSVDYAAALELQNALVAARIRGEVGDTLLLLEHPHVFTLGRGADARFLLNPADVPVYRVSRGGQVTYHGPGQLIGYPILKLEGQDRDVIGYLRRLEQAIAACTRALRNHRRPARRTNRRVGRAAEDRLDRRRHPSLGHAARLRPQRHHRSELLQRNRAVRPRGLPDDLSRRAWLARSF